MSLSIEEPDPPASPVLEVATTATEADDNPLNWFRALTNAAWIPEPGTVGEDLLLLTRDRPRWWNEHQMRRFVRLGFDWEGWWWCWAIRQSAASLPAGDKLWLEMSWFQYLAGERPFRPRRWEVA